MGASMERSGAGSLSDQQQSHAGYGVPRPMRRADFLAVSKGRRYSSALLTVQAGPCHDRAGAARFGFVLTRKLGNAVERNRMRRRLRAAIRETSALAGSEPNDFVVIGRRALLSASFDAIRADLTLAFSRVMPRSTPLVSTQKDRH